jgi:WD40 repeat protein
MRGLIAVLLFVCGVAFGLAETAPPAKAPGAAADASGPTQPASADADEPPVLVPAGERFDNLAGIVADLGRQSPVRVIAISPDGRSLASGSDDNTIRLWDVASGKELRRLEGHTRAVQSVAFSPDGRSLASGSGDISPDGRSLASGSGDKTIRLWDVASGKELPRLEGHTEPVRSVAFAPDGRSLASGSTDNTIRLWDLSSGKELLRLEGHTEPVRSVAFAPDGRSLASGSKDNTIRLWDLASGKELRRLQGHTGPVDSVAVAPDGRSLASGSKDGTIRLWDLASGRELRRLEGHTNVVWSVAFSPDGRSLASGSWDGTIRLWDVSSGKELRRLEGQTGFVYPVAFSPDGRSLASGSQDNTIRLWDLSSGKELRRLEGHTDNVTSVAFAPDGRSLASASWDGTVRLWDLAGGQEQRRLEGRTQQVYSIAFAPDGRSLASGSWDKTIRLWDLASGNELRLLEGHTDLVFSVAFAPDGLSLASGSWDKTIRLWDVASGRELRRLEGHTEHVFSVAFAPEGRSLASASSDGTIRLWDPGSGKELGLMVGGVRPICGDLLHQQVCRSLRYGLWLACREDTGLCWRGDDGTMLARPDADGLLHPILPAEALQADRGLPTVSFPHSIEAAEGATVPVKFELKNVGAAPLFWLSIHAEPTRAEADAASVAFQSPPTIMRLEPGDSALVVGWLSVSFPYLAPTPQTLTLPLTLEEAGGRVALDPITVSAEAPIPTIEEAHLSKTAGGDQSVLATLVNAGTASLRGFSTEGHLHDKAQQDDHSQDPGVGAGSSPSSDPNAAPTLGPHQKTTITFAVQKETKVPGKPELELAVRAVNFPLHEWQVFAPLILPGLAWSLFAAAGAGILVLAGLAYYQVTYRDPILVAVSANPSRLVRLDLSELGKARALLARTWRLDSVLHKAEVTRKWLDDAIGTFTSPDPRPRAELLARRLEAKIKSEAAGDSFAAYELALPEDFKLKVNECVLAFPKPGAAAGDVLSAWRQSEAGKSNLITLVIASDPAQRQQLQRQLDARTESVVVLERGDETSLLLSAKPLDTLARIISARIDPTRISPYQINAGVERETVFFGRTEELKHILNRDPANYLIVGARQLGKSSLLKAIERRVEQRGDMLCDYMSVALDSFEAAVGAQLGLGTDASLADIVKILRDSADRRPRWFLIDEADGFIEKDSNQTPRFPVLHALRSLSSEGRCFFIVAGFWKLFELANLRYFGPIRNFGEPLTLGPLEPQACRALVREPMEMIGIRYAEDRLIDRIVEQTGRRPNLIQIVCNEMVRRIGGGREIDAPLVESALSSDPVKQALAWGSLTSDERGSRIDRIVVYAMLERDSFSLGDVIESLKVYDFKVSTDALHQSLQRLTLAFVFGEERGVYFWRVPLFRERRRLEEPKRQIADEVAAAK